MQPLPYHRRRAPAPLAPSPREVNIVRPAFPASLLAHGLLALILALGGALSTPGPAWTQEPPDTVQVRPEPSAEDPDDVELPDIGEPTTPGGAFLRAVLVPGWGHASIGAYTRGAFYFLAESSAVWMLLRTNSRLGSARDIRGLRADAARARLVAEGVTDPFELEEGVEEDELVSEAQSLVEAREQQFEDWVALGIFLVFLSGADAFVSAHLADFPEPVQVGVRPVGPDRVEIGLSIAVGGPGRR